MVADHVQAVVHREIAIDCGHRVPDHAGKCASPHGHRYRIIATCTGDIRDRPGADDNGMVIDFGRIKTFMLDILDAVFDHGFVVAGHDAIMMNMFFPGEDPAAAVARYHERLDGELRAYGAALVAQESPRPITLPPALAASGTGRGMKIIPVPYTPTAENMARHMYDMMRQALRGYDRCNRFELVNIRLYETPNGWVDYPGARFMDGTESG